ncbi:hypothetical protein GOQ30_00690 [Flavobacterium sp. TP390]|uniref:Uncharacterized protein n=1 Tax=Flavobacterium profundi TaxID=1774945 RepID=A0A6I4IDM9_9FLAO|nr:hypothetical protein [Flavobacterium profundi]MVO07675.1 hypothetical protein [Flavobacterium profundi]
MKKLNSKLFESLQLNETEMQSCTGGNYTSRGTDTALSSTQYDVVFQTTDEKGGNGVWDNQNTGAGTKDQPTPATLTQE